MYDSHEALIREHGARSRLLLDSSCNLCIEWLVSWYDFLASWSWVQFYKGKTLTLQELPCLPGSQVVVNFYVEISIMKCRLMARSTNTMCL
jgi:hypothetical protein